MNYTVRVIATNVVSDTIDVKARSPEEALAKVKQRINSRLKQEGYEFQLEFLRTVGRARVAA